MFFSMGIQSKITLAFYLLLFMMIASVTIPVVIGKEVRYRVVSIEFVENVLNTILEIRRFEKNYFLYKEENSFLENRKFIEKLEGLLKERPLAVTSVISEDSLNVIQTSLSNYKSAMEQLYDINHHSFTGSEDGKLYELEEVARTKGQKMTGIVELSVKVERLAVQKLLKTTGWVLLLAMLAFMVTGVVLVTILKRSIIKSMKILEDHTRKISKGEFVAAPIDVKDEELISLLKAFNLMTNELKLRQKKLVQSEKLASLGTLLSGVAHELNNPLSNISSSAQILAEEIEDDDLEFKKSIIHQIIAETDRAGDIVRSLLEFARNRDFKKKTFALKKLVEESKLLVRAQMPSKVTVHIDISSELTIIGDKQRLKQVFLNLLKNAIDALGDEGNVWISSNSITNNKTGCNETEIVIEDDGPGIPENIRSKIFDPFFTTKDVGHGSGLGLYLVHDIIERHGGTIRIDCRSGQGTSFIIWLPCLEEDS